MNDPGTRKRQLSYLSNRCN
nr:ribosomal protein S16 [Helleborus lividus]WIW41844.1 ribosomal protein S16 [Helleborus lividus]